MLFFLHLLQRHVSAGLINMNERIRRLVCCAGIDHLAGLLLRIAYSSAVGILSVEVYYFLRRLLTLQLGEFPVLVGNVDVVLHVLILNLVVAQTTASINLHRLGQVQRYQFIRLYFLSVSLACSLHWNNSRSFASLMHFHGLVWGCLGHETESRRSHVGCCHHLILGQRYRIV